MLQTVGAAAPYVSLFALSFLAATLIPAQSELVVGAMLASGRYDAALLLSVATVGNTLGSCVNWLLGRYAGRFQDRRWFPIGPAQLVRAERWYAKWGRWSLLFSWLPVVGDALTLAAGLLRTPFVVFVILVLFAKGGRYLVIAGAVDIAFR